MKQFTDALQKCKQNENWYAALSLALSLPDICGKFEHPNNSSTQRYRKWFDQHLGHIYMSQADSHTFLSGSDCYALRCAYLHEGTDDITDQRVRQALTNFRFITPPKGRSIHCNQVNSQLQLQVDVFCDEISEAVESWYNSLPESKRSEVDSKLAKIEFVQTSITFTFPLTPSNLPDQ